MSEYTKQLQKITDKFSQNEITLKDMDYFKENFNKVKVVSILENILNDDKLLKTISDRSYTHALGFDKIVLMDLSKDIEGCNTKTQLRLHLWDAQNDAVPMVESMHEHSFNFISTVLSGRLENQIFKVGDISEKEALILEKLNIVLEKIKNKEKEFINQQLEIIEAIKLEEIGSNQLLELKMQENANIAKAMKITGFNSQELYQLTAIEGHYVSNRVRGEKKAYKHVFNKYLNIVPHEVMHIEEGGYYFHPYQYPHRLYYDNKILNSTILITTPVKDNPQGGSLQRPTYINENEKDYDKKSITVEQMKIKLESYINFLSNK
jgi:hypothetical protein